MTSRFAAWVSIVSVTASCGSSPDVKYPELDFTLPSGFRAGVSTGGEVEQEWWKGFDDPRIEKVVEEVLAHNHDLLAAAARIRIAAVQARIAGADIVPHAAGRFGASKFQQKFFGLDIPGRDDVITTRAVSYGISLDLSWELDLWGRIRSARSAALADLEVSEADLLAARLSLIAQTLKIWFGAAEAQRQVELARRTVESRRSTKEWAASRYRKGIGTPAEVRLFRSNEAAAEALLHTRAQQLEGLIRQLEIIMGRYPSAGLVAGDDLPEIPSSIPAGLPADLIARRPDLAAAERRLAAADSRVAESRAALYPRISLTASGGTASDELVQLLDGRFWVWSLASNILAPLFQGGRLRAQVDLAQARSEEVTAQFLGSALRAYGEVESALAALDHLRRRESALDRSAREAREAERLARDRYTAGLEGPNTLFEAQRAALTADSLLLQTRRERIDARINLHLALGGGFRPRPAPEGDSKDEENKEVKPR